MTEAAVLSLGSCGAHALRLLRAESPLRVAAVFERSFYLESAGAFACLGGPRIELGPLNAVLEVPEGMNWRASGLRADMRCVRSAGALHLGPRFVLSLSEARPWRPEAPPVRPDPAAVARALRAVHTESPLHDLDAGRAAMAGAGRWLSAVFARAPKSAGEDLAWVSGLIGLGPGLTPSGDDFIGGVLIALHALNHPEPAQRLAGAALPAAASASNAISAAHLAAAGEGQGSAALHRLLNDVLRGDGRALEARLAAVGRIGHTSGWDTLAGSLAVLRAWLAGAGARRKAA